MDTVEFIIEHLRSRLVQEAMTAGNLTDDKVVQLSRQLDGYIVEYQKLKGNSCDQWPEAFHVHEAVGQQ